MTRPITTTRAPKPSELAATQRRRAVAAERVKAHLGGMLDGLDPETRMETRRAAIRALAIDAAQDGSEARACGVLSGALTAVAPAYRGRPGLVAAEALFGKVAADE